jgi:hypothetical protein
MKNYSFNDLAEQYNLVMADGYAATYIDSPPRSILVGDWDRVPDSAREALEDDYILESCDEWWVDPNTSKCHRKEAVVLMNAPTGSVDSAESWIADYLDTIDDETSWEDFSKTLIEVVPSDFTEQTKEDLVKWFRANSPEELVDEEALIWEAFERCGDYVPRHNEHSYEIRGKDGNPTHFDFQTDSFEWCELD